MAHKKTTEQFIKEAIIKHGDKYDYCLINYKDAHSKVKIICRIHGVFIQEPNEHLKGCGCHYCAVYSKKHPNAKLTGEEFINKARVIHNNKYNYDKVIYITSKTNIIITCPQHGDFIQTPNAHLSRRGCPLCPNLSFSKGEQDIYNYLTKNNILFIHQKKFNAPVPYNKLRYDFYLPKLNTIIEFNGLQHYKKNNFFGNGLGFEKQQNADKRKEQYCLKNNIILIILSYKDFNNHTIEKKLETLLGMISH